MCSGYLGMYVGDDVEYIHLYIYMATQIMGSPIVKMLSVTHKPYIK